jgi:hypothetical protein
LELYVASYDLLGGGARGGGFLGLSFLRLGGAWLFLGEVEVGLWRGLPGVGLPGRWLGASGAGRGGLGNRNAGGSAFCKQCPAGVALAFTFRTYGTRLWAFLEVTDILPLWGMGCAGAAGAVACAQILHFLFLDEKKQKFPVMPGLIVLNGKIAGRRLAPTNSPWCVVG